MQSLVFVAWQPPDVPAAVQQQAENRAAPSDAVSLGLARRASDHMVERPGVAQEEATMRAAWEVGLAVLSPVAGRRLGVWELGFVTDTDATQESQALFEALRRDHPGGDWRVGVARLDGVGIMQAARALELWVLDGGEDGSWLVDATELSAGPC
jgi:hypothetical protein